MNQSLERKLAAIMFTDIAGYTEQMSKDQDAAFILLEEKADAMEEDLKLKFLSYPIPKAIVEEWERAK